MREIKRERSNARSRRVRAPFRKTRVAVCSIRGRYWREFNADLKASRPRIEKEMVVGREKKKKKEKRERKNWLGAIPFRAGCRNSAYAGGGDCCSLCNDDHGPSTCDHALPKRGYRIAYYDANYYLSY